MANVRMPNGDIVSFPDDMPKEQIRGLIQQKFPELADKSPQNAIQETAPQQSIPKTILDQSMQGATLGFGDELTSALAAGVVAPMTGQKFGDVYKQGQELSKSQLAAQQEQNPVTSLAAGLGGGLLTGVAGASTRAGSAVSGGVSSGLLPKAKGLAARAGNLFSKGLIGGGAGATTGAIYGAGTAEEGKRQEGAKSGAILGGSIGAAIPLATAGGGALVSALAPTVDEGLLEVANIAKKYKIPLSLDEITGSKAMKNIQKVSQELPFSGQNEFRDKQLRSFNRALTNTFGENSERITPELMDRAFGRVGKMFDNLGKGKTFTMESSFKDQIDEVLRDAPSVYNADALNNFDKELAVVAKNVMPDGSISGEKLAFLRSRANQLARKTSNPDTRELMHDLENAIIDVMTAGDDAEKQILSTAKQQYKNLLVIEPLAQKAKAGNISPSLLNNRVGKIYGRQATRGKAGEIGDLARVANELLPELGGSDTVQKAAIFGLGAGAAGAAPITTASTLAANRGYQALINRNPRLIEKAIQKAEQQKLLSGQITPEMIQNSNRVTVTTPRGTQ